MLDAAVKVTTDALDSLIRMLEKPLAIDVGILGTGSRFRSTNSNAEIGAQHEFGIGVPRRSFLWDSMTNKGELSTRLAQNLSGTMLGECYETRSLDPLGNALGKSLVGVVEGSFSTGGYGKWKAWGPGYNNETGQILVNTGQLAGSVSYDIVRTG